MKPIPLSRCVAPRGASIFVLRVVKATLLILALFIGVTQSSAQLPANPVTSSPKPLPIVATAVEPIDGVGNNVANPRWGSAGSDLVRLAPVGYADGIDAPSLPNDLSARAISNILNNQIDPQEPAFDYATIDQNSLSDYGYVFGQFVDHDMDLTLDGGASFPIPVAAGDPIGPDPLPFTRSQTDPATGTSAANPAQQTNVVTSYLDLSQVYGSNATVAAALRTFTGGQLKTSPGNMLPYNNTTYFTPAQLTALNMANDAGAVDSTALFAAGDRRANENIELTALETLFVRNHNRIASQLKNMHSNWTDEQFYQEARKLNIAGYQSVIYNEWIPAVFGARALSNYNGYKPNVNASISNEFSTVAFRFGHSNISASIARDSDQGQVVLPAIPLAYDFFDPNLLNPNGVVDPLTGLVSTDIGPILKGDADGNGQAMDLLAVEAVRNLLFGNGGFGGDDLMARDIQRGRDNGIPDYNTLRVALGLPPVTTFDQIVVGVNAVGGDAAGEVTSSSVMSNSDQLIVQELKQAYPAGVNAIDPFEAGLAEHHVVGSDVGPTFQAIIVDQFRRLRDGDRYFYLNQPFSSEEQNLLQQTNSLAEVIAANTSVTNLQSDVMLFRASISGTVTSGNSLQAGGLGGSGAGGGIGGVTLRLQDLFGNVLATTTTNSQGGYTFNQLSGPAADPVIAPGVSVTGTYVISIVLPAGWRQVSANPAPIVITRGELNISNVNFRVATTSPR